MNVAEAMLEQLRLWGVKRIYGVAGDAIFGLLDAIAKQNAILFVSVKHESVAALMAAAEAKLTGKLSVCAAQMGPGLANLINGLGSAFMDGNPVLAITGQAPLNKIGTSYKQYINQQQLVRAIANFTELVVHPDAVLDSLSRATHISITGETVSHLSIPVDVFTMPARLPPANPIQGTAILPDADSLKQALQIMKMAKRPMLLLGGCARDAGKEMEQLAEVWGCGIAWGYGATGGLPDCSPSLLGGLGEGGNPYLTGRFREADVVMVVGTSWWPEGHTPPQDTQVIQVENSCMKLGHGIPADCAIVGETIPIVAHLVKELQQHQVNPEWTHQIQQCKHSWALQNEKEGLAPGEPLHPSRIMRAIEKSALPDAIIALDEGDSTLWFMRNFRAARQHILQSEMWRTMGFGLPAALAAKLSQPDKQVLCVTGDGGLAMVLADLLTVVRYQLSITLILLNNGSLQMERNKMTAKGLMPEGTNITNPDFVQLAIACGWNAKRVGSGDELEALLQSAKSNTKPLLLDVPTAQIPYPNYSNE